MQSYNISINPQNHGVSFEESESVLIADKLMEPEYPLLQMKRRPNPFAKPLKKEVTISLGIDVIEYFEKMAQEEGLSYQEVINLYLQDCVTTARREM
ncbi:antitoxin [Laspinema palackyanum]|uniref:antitoxin n=1 Tax=Laspinema palackyanum TaxID=3231601 RepID=UPI00345DA418|nr:antitoxin [Laspinema sp. D2c]